MRLSHGILFALALALLPLLAVPGTSATWHVPSQCPTIHAGLDSASAGDTVLVGPGTYPKSDNAETYIHPGSGITLASEDGPEATIIEMCGSVAIFMDHCEGTVVSGFTLRSDLEGPDCWGTPTPKTGIWCQGCTDVVVESCIIESMSYGIYVAGTSSEWAKPLFKNNIIRDCMYGVECYEMHDPGRPLFQGNVITNCSRGSEIENSSPQFYGNRIELCSEYGMFFWGNCTGNCAQNTICNNGAGVYVSADPPLGAPSFNGSWEAALANDFHDNAGLDISYNHGPGLSGMMAIFNYWGSKCPDFDHKLLGDINYEPWMDSTHTQSYTDEDCPEATEPTTWGAIKAMYR
jgi:hypothetical protein